MAVTFVPLDDLHIGVGVRAGGAPLNPVRRNSPQWQV